jgi:hypothetical protein
MSFLEGARIDVAGSRSWELPQTRYQSTFRVLFKHTRPCLFVVPEVFFSVLYFVRPIAAILFPV